MRRGKIFIYVSLVTVVLIGFLYSTYVKPDEAFSQRSKISIREAGNQLLLKNHDSTSLILPVKSVGAYTYQLSFEKPLFFEPSDLVFLLDSSLKKANLPKNYLVEVIQCANGEVAYSYEISSIEQNTIIPCSGRYLTKQCYLIEVKFIKRLGLFTNPKYFLYALVFIVTAFLLDYLFNKKTLSSSEESMDSYSKLGSFQFYPEQNKLIKEAQEINLSKKECELLELFVASPNQVIKRDELTKKVWEDNGVFVGRSLDTYISKLRKKLKGDTSIKLINIHGVGYKLEIGN